MTDPRTTLTARERFIRDSRWPRSWGVRVVRLAKTVWCGVVGHEWDCGAFVPVLVCLRCHKVRRIEPANNPLGNPTP